MSTRQMLPSSHLAPMNGSDAHKGGADQIDAPVDSLRIDRSCHRLDALQGETALQERSALLLAGEFSEFIAAASRLEISYRELQAQVSDLGFELSERNAALKISLAEIERMRLDLQQIVDSMPCGVLVLDRNGRVSMINPESRRLLGLDSVDFGEGSAKTLQQMSTWSGVNLEASYESALCGDSGQEFCICEPEGKRWLEVRNRRLFRQGGTEGVPDQTILILRDITAQKRAEQEREAGRKAMALAEITTILAHEIRNPLASLELFAELIEKDEHRRGEWVSNLRAGIRSLSGTVNNVLSFHGSGSFTLVPVALPALIWNAIQFIQPLADQAEVSLEWLVDQDQLFVMGNQSALQQVVLNLIANAIRHTPQGGKVNVSIRLEEGPGLGEDRVNDCGQIIAEFSDNGCGIQTDQICHIFEPGFSGSSDRSGLGLAVCERIMKQHGGRISASNGVHSGARFTLYFPAFQMELATA
jgi:PAS domain S-box-containing protein